MIIEERKITIKEVSKEYFNDAEEGVVGYNNRLDIRPKYQREFVYKDVQRDEVIRSIMKGLPLNVFYWARTSNDKYEVLDGQQRTISFCEYVDGNFSVDSKYFDNLPKNIQNDILNYELFVYVCDGEDSEKLEWFQIINIAGEKLTNQELRNAVYAGPWVTDAKRHFSKSNSVAYGISSDYMSGLPIRQDYLETALKWISSRDQIELNEYMAINQHLPNANALWRYFKDVIEWTKLTFPVYRTVMKGIQWGLLYNEYNDITYNTSSLEEQIKTLMEDDDVTNKKGIYQYVLDGREHHLNIRAFTNNQKREAYERQNGICPVCKEHFNINEMEADHITPWSQGGKTSADNCQMLCKEDNRRKSNI